MHKQISSFLRAFVQYSGIVVLLLLVSIQCKPEMVEEVANSPWDNIDELKSQIVETDFPDQEFLLEDFGGKGDGLFNNTEAFKLAIAECTSKGGGKVIVPAGDFYTGPIHLDNNVNLHLMKGAVILFSQNPDDYYPLVHTSWEGTELMNYSPLIYAFEKENIAVTGEGTINGQANLEHWWPWKGSENYGWKEGEPHQNQDGNRPFLVEQAANNVAVEDRVFGRNHYMRPTFIEPFACHRVLIQGIKIINAPFWIIHPIKSKNVIVDGVTIESHGPNNDGCDPEYSENVWIKNCIFNTGDDCIAIKAGRNEDGRRVAMKSHKIIVEDCQMIDGHGGVVIGSEISAGVSDVYVQNCTMNSPNLDRAIRVKTNTKRGGTIENLFVRNIEVGQVRESVIRLNMFYSAHGNQVGEFIPVIRNIHLENIHVRNGGKYGLLVEGLTDSPIHNVYLNKVTIDTVEEVFSIKNARDFYFKETYINGKLIDKI